ncbi:unnamed protein product [Acanthoscelides obtectus]|uniref:Uncharacterized protein n=2 Tax=Acanthoscelides obtectus TaxID=200917 RepID=A0A9P0M4U6_ACAOB|nr:unnamed protein product [Acanthoscelides obtectus]CAK1641293.1 hypothetical protein AOBTE_LOCUS12306 [Acanthoscelides obtectus]
MIMCLVSHILYGTVARCFSYWCSSQFKAKHCIFYSIFILFMMLSRTKRMVTMARNQDNLPYQENYSVYSEDKTETEYLPSTNYGSSAETPITTTIYPEVDRKRNMLNPIFDNPSKADENESDGNVYWDPARGLLSMPLSPLKGNERVENWLQTPQNDALKSVETSCEDKKNTQYTGSVEGVKSDTILNAGKKIEIIQNIILNSDNTRNIFLPADEVKTVKEGARRGESLQKGQKAELTDIEKRTHFEDVIPRQTDLFEEEIVINTAEKKEGKRFRNKVHSCYFCMKLFQNVPRHFETIHSSETIVAKVLAMEKNSKIRKNAFAELIRVGDFNHNCEVLSLKRGELILVRRPTELEAKSLSYSDYGPCPKCLGFMLKRHLWHHTRNCELQGNGEPNGSKMVVAESNAILNEIFGKQLSREFSLEILGKMREDDVGRCCVNDSLIIKFGALMFEKYDVTQGALIRQSMRQLGV